MILKCIAVDDEPVALEMISQYIGMTPSLQLAASCHSAVEAMRILHAQPDIQLIFLDIRMADLSGMERSLHNQHKGGIHGSSLPPLLTSMH